MSRQELIIQKEASVAKFASIMTFIVNAVHSKLRHDDDFNEIRDGYLAARTENPECIMMVAGPYVWEYREIIMSGNLKPLLNKDFRAEISERSDDIRKSARISIDKIYILVEKIKKVWFDFKSSEQEVLKQKFKDMVGQYATYLALCKRI